MRRYALITGLIQFAIQEAQIFDFEIDKSPHTITEPSPPCFLGGVIQSAAALSTNSSPHIDYPIWLKDF